MESKFELYMSAVKQGDLATVKIWLEDTDLDINLLTEDGHSGFETALACGFKNIAELILNDVKFEVNTTSSNPLRTAIQYGFIDMAITLLDRGANPNIRFVNSSSALLLALENDYYDLSTKMVECGAEVNIRNPKGLTPLIWASLSGYKRTVEFLIENGADINVTTNDGWNAITGAFFKGQVDIIDLLMKHGAAIPEKYAEAALVSSYKSGNTKIFNNLLEKGTNVNVLDEDGQPLFIIAVYRADYDNVDLLLKHGANPNTVSKAGVPAILFPSKVGDDKLVTLLVGMGAEVNLADKTNNTAITFAAKYNNVSTVELLIKNGSNINQQGGEGCTPLMYAAQDGWLLLCKTLLNHGANSSITYKAKGGDIGAQYFAKTYISHCKILNKDLLSVRELEEFRNIFRLSK